MNTHKVYGTVVITLANVLGSVIIITVLQYYFSEDL